jgi:hypothetical protein
VGSGGTSEMVTDDSKTFRLDNLESELGRVSVIGLDSGFARACLKTSPLMVAQWLRYCATNRKVAGSIPDDVIGIFH